MRPFAFEIIILFMKYEADDEHLENVAEKLLLKYAGATDLNIRRILSEEALLPPDESRISGRFAGLFVKVDYQIPTAELVPELHRAFSELIAAPDELVNKLAASENISRDAASRLVLIELLIEREKFVADALENFEQMVLGGGRFREAEKELLKESLKHGLEAARGDGEEFDEEAFETTLRQTMATAGKSSRN